MTSANPQRPRLKIPSVYEFGGEVSNTCAFWVHVQTIASGNSGTRLALERQTLTSDILVRPRMKRWPGRGSWADWGLQAGHSGLQGDMGTA
jgi:hypothetical protein